MVEVKWVAVVVVLLVSFFNRFHFHCSGWDNGGALGYGSGDLLNFVWVSETKIQPKTKH